MGKASIVIGLLACALAGCLESTTVLCAGGFVCPAGTACDEVHRGCVLPSQLAGCTAETEGMTCDIAGEPTGACSQGVCVRAGCGDGFVTGAEQCDGANMGAKPNASSCKLGHGFHDDGVVTCNADCTYNLSACSRICGDGVLDPEEACDGDQLGASTSCQEVGFYEGGTLKCSAACQYDTSACSRRCGDGVKDPEEACDGGLLGSFTSCQQLGYYDGGALSCSPGCQYDTSSCSRRCGDGIRDPEEACDGDQLGSATCQQLGYYDGTALSCNAACQYDTSSCMRRCGDGVKDPEEACDGNQLGAITTCQGAGFYDGGAVTCTAGCQHDTSSCSRRCGDGIKDAEEACDGTELGTITTCQAAGFYDGGAVTCTATCQHNTSTCSRRCGDGVKDAEEACDGTQLGSVTTCQQAGFYSGGALSCSASCQYNTSTCSRRCGDGVLDPEEACDGSQFGTITTCQQAGFYSGGSLTCNASCQLNTSTCSRRCGDGIKDPEEACDGSQLGAFTTCQQIGYYQGGNLSCTSACQYNTIGCSGRCGDGTKDPAEACDGADLGPYSTCQDIGFYDGGNLSCNLACQYDESTCSRYCGDGVTDFPEELCDGGPPQESCIDFGYDAGFLACVPLACTGDISDCKRFGWKSLTLGVPEYVLSLFPLSDRIIGGLTDGKIMTYRDGKVTVELVDTVDEGFFVSVWASGPNDIFALTERAVWHYNGTSWTRTQVRPDNGSVEGQLWGTGPNNVYLFTYYSFGTTPNTSTLRYNGSTWQPDTTVPYFGFIKDVWGSGPNDIWVIEDSNTIYHYDGTWTDVSATVPVAFLQTVGGFGSEVMVGGHDGTGRQRVAHRVGGVWQVHDLSMMMPSYSSISLLEIYARAANDVWVGGQNWIFHFDGSAWTVTRISSQMRTFAALGNEVLAGGYDQFLSNGGQYRYRGSSVSDLTQADPQNFSTEQVLITPRWTAGWAAAADDMWAASLFASPNEAFMHHFDGIAWTYQGIGFKTVADMWGVAPTEIYAAIRNDGVLRFGGSTWAADPNWTVTFPDDVHGVWGTTGNVWAVGNKIWKRGVSSWATELTVVNNLLYDVHGRSATDVWAVGSSGLVYHYNGAMWLQIPVPTTEDLRAVWTAPGAHVFIVGDNGVILRFDGAQWIVLGPGSSPTTLGLKGVFGHAQDDVFAVGDVSTVLHFDGANWAPVKIADGEPLLEVIGAGQTTVLMGGNQGSGPQLARQLNRTVPW